MNKIQYIPLGTHCSAASVLRDKFQLRDKSFPFDWISIPCPAITSLINMPQDNIDQYVSDYLDQVRSQRHPDGSYFPHHFIATNDYESQLSDLKARFSFLYKRLFDTLQSDALCVFLSVFHEPNENESEDYFKMIDAVFSKLKLSSCFFVSVNVLDLHFNRNHYNINVPHNGHNGEWEERIAVKLNSNKDTRKIFNINN